MQLRKRLAELETTLHGRELVYFGVRGADAEPLLRLSSFSSVFSIIAPLEAQSVSEVSVEAETRERVDLDSYNIDLDCREGVRELRARLLHMFDRPSAVLPYRPCGFLSSAWFPRSDRVAYLGMFHEAQATFEHKPWVETQLSENGVRVLPWRYWADSERSLIAEWAAREALVLRANHTDGGLGVRLVREPSDLEVEWPAHGDGFLAAAPYLAPSIPLNINGCVFPDGTVTLHGPSLQLIGIPGLTARAFGYCGNDFASVADLEPHTLNGLEDMTIRAGRWLHRHGYLGAFGIDALLHDGLLYLTEINPRFQGSSLLSARLDALCNRPDVYLDHAASFLGLAAVPAPPLRDLVREQLALAHVVCHNVEGNAVQVASDPPAGAEAEYRLQAAPAVAVLEGAVTFDIVVPDRVSADGHSLRPNVHSLVAAATACVRPTLGPCSVKNAVHRS